MLRRLLSRPARAPSRPCSTRALLYYQSDRVPCSLTSTGLVGTCRDAQGSDGEFFGVDPQPAETPIASARGRPFSLDANGFCRLDDPLEHICYYDNTAVLDSYYAHCEATVARHTGAARVLAFDHNVRSRRRKQAAARLSGEGANAVQEPLVSYGVHNDYTLTSAARRVEQLARPLSTNDTLRARADMPPPIVPAEVEPLLRGRWCFINVWRNVSPEPVQQLPLALCDAATVSNDDLVVFEIRYADRVGENYFARRSERHRWWYFPLLTRDECVLIKCWDSRGASFAGRLEQMRGWPPPDAASAVPATFSLHTGFVDPLSSADAPDRESIEVRLIAFFS
ncbi:hypothetical protein AB1Y20_010654 [Prymnesium parvum]|uniref:Uncharacterized protein n=1 Tax=Prymnesium parvum TaxID=97485 RepID=A0AB34IQ54_PRYPA